MKKSLRVLLLFSVLFILFGCDYEAVDFTENYMYLSSLPEKTLYEYGECLDLSGIRVREKGYDKFYNYHDELVTEWSSNPKEGKELYQSGNINVTISYNDITTSFEIFVKENPASVFASCERFFWGKWVRMDNGKEYEILEKEVLLNNESPYSIIASDDNSITVTSLGTFKKESDSVIVCNNIPYFRNGGTNLEYLLKVVGFSSSRAEATIMSEKAVPRSGIHAKGKSTKYDYEDEAVSDEDGMIKLTAPTVNDPQTVTIRDGDNTVVIQGLNITNSGEKMGTVALVGKNDCNLKISGVINESQKDAGYLYGNNYKTYEMVLTITNISNSKWPTSVCSLKAQDSRLSLLSMKNEKQESMIVYTMVGGNSVTEKIKVSFGNMTEPYIDTGIFVTLTNAKGQEWEDFVPLRFYRGKLPITVAAKNPEGNNNSVLNGFVIYPDGNSQYFSVKNNSSKVLYVPTFGSDKLYKMVFSGATVTSNLADSTEMFYSVAPNSKTKKDIDLNTNDWRVIDGYMNYGGENHTEDTAFPAESGFIGYLPEGEIDYYTIKADSN